MKQITIEITDEYYEVLEQTAKSTSITIKELVSLYIWDVAVRHVTPQVLHNRVIIAQAVRKAKEYEPGKIFTVKDILPTTTQIGQLAAFCRHVHTALQSDASFVKLEDERNPLIRYSRV